MFVLQEGQLVGYSAKRRRRRRSEAIPLPDSAESGANWKKAASRAEKTSFIADVRIYQSKGGIRCHPSLFSGHGTHNLDYLSASTAALAVCCGDSRCHTCCV
jgi:trehalose-6-phosphatase